MSKAEKISQINTEIMNEFIDTQTSYQVKLNYRNALKLFLDLWNGDKNEDITWNFNKSIFDVKMGDVIKFQNFLNKSQIWCLKTKTLKFIEVRSFLKYILRIYNEEFGKFERLEFKADLNEKDNYKWDTKGHKQPNTYYKRLVMTKEEIFKILTYLYDNDFQKYLIFRTLAESGMRKGEVISIDIERNIEGQIISLEQDLKNRCLRVEGKKGLKKYFISKQLAEQLLNYLINYRLKKQTKNKTNAFFISQKRNRFNHASLNHVLLTIKNKDGSIKRKGILDKTGIDKHITPQTFRRTLNTLRSEMNCSVENREVLLNHKSSHTNINFYTIKRDDTMIQLYDTWNPYNKLFNKLI